MAVFSTQRKIIALFLFIMLMLSVVFTFTSLGSGSGGGIWTFFTLIYFFALFTVTYQLHNLKKILKKAYKPLIAVFYSGMILFFVIFTACCFLILGYESNDIPDNPDLIIVLGCQAFGYTPSNTLKSRLDAAVDALNKYPGAACIVSGGQGPDETVPEAVVMKKYLVDKEIDGGRIYEEAESSSSFENLTFSGDIIKENNLKHEDIIIITSEFHIPRSIMIAKRIYPGVQFYAVKAKSPFPIIFPLFNSGIVRECFAFVKSYIFDKVQE